MSFLRKSELCCDSCGVRDIDTTEDDNDSDRRWFAGGCRLARYGQDGSTVAFLDICGDCVGTWSQPIPLPPVVPRKPNG